MRWLSTNFLHNFRTAEHGVSSVVTAGMMVMFLGFAAISVDVGRLYWEKAQLQNGADAGALALASICGTNKSDPQCNNGSSVVRQLANNNANDSSARVHSVSIDTATRQVSVTTSSSEAGAPLNTVSTWFAGVLDPKHSSVEVGATAKARWGSVKSLNAKFPLAFSRCEVDSTSTQDGSLRFLMSKGVNDTNGPQSCHSSSSGSEIPGGFGWLQRQPPSSCSASTSVGAWASSETGNDFPAVCTSRLAEWKNNLINGKKVIVLLPVFDKVQGTGSNGQFRVYAYAAIDVRGWKFNGNNDYLPTEAKKITDKYLPSDLGIVGVFVRYVFDDEDAEFGGGGVDYGSNLVQITE